MGVDFPADFQLILASQSPRRHSLLRDIGVPFTVVPSRAEEVLTGGDAAALAARNAAGKVDGAVLPAGVGAGVFVLGTDTLVSVGGRVMGKPSSAEEAAGMLAALSGRVHQVVSGVALARTSSKGSNNDRTACRAELEQTRLAVATTEVVFRPLSEGEAEAYVASGEWKGKAGGYAIQGIAALFTSEVRGEYSNVVGLPLCLLGQLFREWGFDLVQRRWLQQPAKRHSSLSPLHDV
jgi:septum formation protein